MIHTIPAMFLPAGEVFKGALVYDYKMTAAIVNSKADLSAHMFSFLQTGQKQVHFPYDSVTVNEHQSVLIRKGNCLFTELLNKDAVYNCRLLFFSQHMLENFIQKHHTMLQNMGRQLVPETPPFFVINNDGYILQFIQSLEGITTFPVLLKQSMLEVKLEELLLYLVQKYGRAFVQYLYSLFEKEPLCNFQQIVESNVHTGVTIAEVAFLCNMSLSTFKRFFFATYKESPGKWFQRNRLAKAQQLLQMGVHQPAEVAVLLGYKNVANFRSAFKSAFGNDPAGERKVLSTGV